MESSWLAAGAASNSVKEMVKEELIRGHELANQLHSDIGHRDGESVPELLLTKIKSTFTTSLALLLTGGNIHDSKGKHTFQANSTIVDSSSSSWEDAFSAIKSTEMFMDARNSSKKRKTARSWSRDAPNLIEDGYAWRRYGQKKILNTIHPRSYFRCSHKYDQGCKATKQVQRVEDELPLFRTTYFENHTCKHNLFHDGVVSSAIPSEEPNNSKFTITFVNNNNNNFRPCKQQQLQHPFPPSSCYPSTERDIMSNHVASIQSSLVSSVNHVPQDQLMVFEQSELLPIARELHSEDLYLRQ